MSFPFSFILQRIDFDLQCAGSVGSLRVTQLPEQRQQQLSH